MFYCLVQIDFPKFLHSNQKFSHLTADSKSLEINLKVFLSRFDHCCEHVKVPTNSLPKHPGYVTKPEKTYVEEKKATSNKNNDEINIRF